VFLEKRLDDTEHQKSTLQDALEETRPQLSTLEAALGEATKSLQEEKQTRRQAEMAQNQAETRARLAESSLLHLTEEKDELLEELAFVGADVEEMTQALTNEKLRHQEVLERLEADYRHQIATMPRSNLLPALSAASTTNGSSSGAIPFSLENLDDDDDNSQESTLLDGIQEEDEDHDDEAEAKESSSSSTGFVELLELPHTPIKPPPSASEGGTTTIDIDSVNDNNDNANAAAEDAAAAVAAANDEQQAYRKSLEDELDLVSEELIETQQQLSDAELKFSEAQERQIAWNKEKLELQKVSEEAIDEATVQSNLAQTAEEELVQLQTQVETLTEQLTFMTQELEASKEELVLVPELELALEQLQTQLDDKVEELLTKEEEFTSIKAQLDADLEELAKIQEDRETTEAQQQQELSHKLQQSTTEKDAAHAEIFNLRSQLAVAEAVGQIKEDNNDDENDHNDNDNDNDKHQLLLIARLQAELETMKGKVERQEAKAQAQQAQASPAKLLLPQQEDAAEVAAAAEEIGSLKAQMEALQSELEQARAELAATRANPEADNNNVGAQEQLKLQTDLDQAKKEVSQKERERQELQTQLETITQQLQETKLQRSIDNGTDTSLGGDELLTTPSPPRAFTPASRQALRSPTHDMFHLTHDDDSASTNSPIDENGGGHSKSSLVYTPQNGARADNHDHENVNDHEAAVAIVPGTKTLTLAQKTQWMRQHNAQLLHQLLALQGNIQVCCRVRPALRGEVAFQSSQSLSSSHAKTTGPTVVVEPLSETEIGVITNPQEVLDSSGGGGDGDNNKNRVATQWKSFQFDKVWGPDTSQFDVFLDVEPLALSVVDGYNACIFAYGQTGSGKTFTMEGSPNNWGISQRTISKIFHLLKQREKQNKENAAASSSTGRTAPSFDIQVGMLEIYNENIYDLLHATSKIDTTSASSLDIRRDAEGRTTVPDLTKEPVNSLQDVMSLLQRGNANRATASTHMNEHSSRSHMVLQVQVTTKSASGDGGSDDASVNVDASATMGSLYLVDLAGSERVRKSNVSGKELREAQYINKSLSALGDVMEALDKKTSHIPYRNSKLTHLLQDSLSVGGGSKTLMVVTVCPTLQSSKETQYALQFAARARNIHLGKASRNNVASTKNLEERIKVMDREMKLLHRAKDRSDEQLALLKRENAKMQDKVNSGTQQARSKSHEENRALVALRKTTNEITMKYEKEKTQNEKHGTQNEAMQREVRVVRLFSRWIYTISAVQSLVVILCC
jgi:kinesin family protein C2/C3